MMDKLYLMYIPGNISLIKIIKIKIWTERVYKFVRLNIDIDDFFLF